MKFTETTKFDVVAARIARRQPTTWWQTVEIDRGEDAKIGPQLPGAFQRRLGRQG
ncbi:MAG: hypothetical protein QM755_24985 [Luteolibacter sp.]